MKIASYTIDHYAVTLFTLFLIIAGGVLAYGELGRLEDPEFTIKESLIVTSYPGASAEEVEREVSEPIETAVQQLKQLEEVRSISRAGLSIVTAEIQDFYDKDSLPQVWDELRRKVGEAALNLPPGCGTPLVNDDFGDVFGVFFALTGDGYSLDSLKEVAEDLRRELLLCEDVGRIDFWGLRPEVVYVEINREKLVKLGISPNAFNLLSQQNSVVSGGDVKIGPESVEMRVTGAFNKVSDMEELLIPSRDGKSMIRLKDIATIHRDYLDPPMDILHRDGKPAIGIGISTISGGNVVNMGHSIKKKLSELENRLPIGMEIHTISFQGDTVEKAVQGFLLNLVEALIIVIILLVIFMGLREGFIIGLILLLTILSTFICMNILDVNLQRISLGALIIALGMLVDNAIVVTEGIVIKMRRGFDSRTAADETVKETMWPLLGATVIAILAFAAISISRDVTGEFLGSLFKVIALSLGLSWILAITITPFLCYRFLKKPEADNNNVLYDSGFYRKYKGFLRRCINHRWITTLVVIGMLFGALFGFRFVDQNFFPDSSSSQFTVDIWHPEGTHIETTSQHIQEISEHIRTMDGVKDITTFTGQGAMRFMLAYAPEMLNSGYGQLLISVEDYRKIGDYFDNLRPYLRDTYPELTTRLSRFVLGPPGGAIEVRIVGPKSETLRSIGNRIKQIMYAHNNTDTIHSNWGNQTKTISVELAEARAREIGVNRPEIATSLSMNFSGMPFGVYRDGDELLPIILRLPEHQRTGIENLENTMVWTNLTQQFVPLEQVNNGIRLEWTDPVIHRINKKRTMKISCDPIDGTSAALFNELRPQIEAIDLPEGYVMEWGGEYEQSNEANEKLMTNVPLVFVLMLLISIILFNTFRHAMIIFAGLPLAIIGVTSGLLLANQPFGFMATLGFLSLAGMLIKNEIVLLDQINLELRSGKKPFQAVIDSGASRVRPVSMAAFTTVLGMIPLLWDPFFGAMAVTIMAGLSFATVLTLIVIPVFYSILFRVKETSPDREPANAN